MAKDTAAASFAAGTSVTSMDRPSVERELRHIHGDTTYYSTAHAARDALTAARAAAPAAATPVDSPPATDESVHQIQAIYSGQRVYMTYAIDLDLKMRLELRSEPTNLKARHLERLLRRIDQDPSLTDVKVDGQPHIAGSPESAETPTTTPRQARVDRNTPLQQAPPGGWTEADLVHPEQPRDTSTYRSAQQFPLGTMATVHAVAEDGGAGRRLGHGRVVDHPSPDHVIVESPYGTRRVAHLNQVSRPTEPPSTTPAAPASVRPPAAEDRWAAVCREIDPRVLQDPHWPALARSLDRIAAGGHDVEQLLHEVTSRRGLPGDNPARSLDYRLADAAPDAATAGPDRPWAADPRGPASSAPSTPISAPQPRRGGPAR